MSGPLGAVSAFLEQRLLATLNEKKLVVWLDSDGAFRGFVDQLRTRAEPNRFPVPVLAYRGSFLELMLALEHEGSTIDRPPLLVHLPGFNTTTVRETPLLELYETAFPFQPNLATLAADAANGRLPLADIETFTRAPGLSLEGADAWLGRAGAGEADSHAEWISQLSAPALVDHLTRTDPHSMSNAEPALRARAEVLFGMTDGWRSGLGDLTERLIAWILCVEFVHDLARPPNMEELLPLKGLPEQTVRRCQQEAARLRKQQPEQYRTWALAVEPWVKEKEETAPKDLGRVDTFQFEALAIYRGAVQALADGNYQDALEWFEAHEASEGFWVQQDQSRRWAWSLVGDAAKLGVALVNAKRPLERASGIEEAVQTYSERCAPVDLAHRRFEQRHATLNASLLHEVTDLSVGLDRLRQAWSNWADQLTRDFARICREHGPLPAADLQQRTLFDQTVVPLLGSGEKVALFVLDALRFEMALELREAMEGSGAQVDLRARLAELPTITAVGMNALAPIERAGRLSPILKDGRFTGFRAGEANVLRPADRVNAIRARLTGKAPLTLDLQDLTQGSVAHLKKQIAQTQLVLVHGLDLDQAGESGFGVRVFADILRDVAGAKHQLELAGVQQFIFTADHGFLLQRGGRSAVEFRGQADRRYVLSDTERNDTGNLCVPLASLGYDAPGFLIVREDTAEYGSTGRAAGAFTHGGNSLQERVIPVLHVSRKRAAQDSGLRYAIECEPATAVLGVQRVRVRVSPAREQGQARLDFASAQPVSLMLRVPARGDVRAVIKDVSGSGAEITPGGVSVRPGTSDWTELYFTLEGPVGERLPIEIALAHDQTVTQSPAATYPVAYVPPAKTEPEAQPEPPRSSTPATPSHWAEKLGDPDAGKAFDHLEKFGSVNEAELVQLLGSARKARAFAARFDSFKDKLTFEVEIVAAVDGKRYQRV